MPARTVPTKLARTNAPRKLASGEIRLGVQPQRRAAPGFAKRRARSWKAYGGRLPKCVRLVRQWLAAVYPSRSGVVSSQCLIGVAVIALHHLAEVPDSTVDILLCAAVALKRERAFFKEGRKGTEHEDLQICATRLESSQQLHFQMRNLRARVEMLERRLLKQRSPDLLESIQQAALEPMSMKDLDLFIAASQAEEEGRTLSPAETAILKVYRSAVKKQCVQAGFRSTAECQRWHHRTYPNAARRIIL
jgi:hypothetical protein